MDSDAVYGPSLKKAGPSMKQIQSRIGQRAVDEKVLISVFGVT